MKIFFSYLSVSPRKHVTEKIFKLLAGENHTFYLDVNVKFIHVSCRIHDTCRRQEKNILFLHGFISFHVNLGNFCVSNLKVSAFHQ